MFRGRRTSLFATQQRSARVTDKGFQMIFNFFDMLFGCWHKNYSFPITAKGNKRRSAAASVTGTYVVCLDCGKEFPYDWAGMKVVSSAPATPRVEHAVAVEWHANKAA